MPAGASVQLQQQIVEALREIDSQTRELTSRSTRAKEVPEVSEMIQTSIEELNDSKTELQRHRVQVRKWITQLSAKHEMRSKLQTTRTSIEKELQAIAALEKCLKERLFTINRDGADSLDAIKARSASEVNESVADDADEVKVQSCQLVSTGDITEELVCKVCYDLVGCQPKLTRCAHLFCGDCLSKWFAAQPGTQTWAQRANSEGRVPCPVCKEPLQEDRDLFTLCKGGANGNGLLWSMLQQTKIRCANHSSCRADGNCEWVGDYGSYQAHIRECQNVCNANHCQATFPDSAWCSTTLGAKPCGTPSQPEQRDRAESESTGSDNNGEPLSDGDFTTSEDAVSDCLAHDHAEPASDGEDEGTRAPLAFDDSAADKPAVSESLVDSISAYLRQRERNFERKVANGESSSATEAPRPAHGALPLLASQSFAPSQRKHVQPPPGVNADTPSFHQQAAHAQHLAQWQHAQMAHNAYAAQWHAAQMQYAAQWRVAQMQYAAQLQTVLRAQQEK